MEVTIKIATSLGVQPNAWLRTEFCKLRSAFRCSPISSLAKTVFKLTEVVGSADTIEAVGVLKLSEVVDGV